MSPEMRHFLSAALVPSTDTPGCAAGPWQPLCEDPEGGLATAQDDLFLLRSSAV